MTSLRNSSTSESGPPELVLLTPTCFQRSYKRWLPCAGNPVISFFHFLDQPEPLFEQAILQLVMAPAYPATHLELADRHQRLNYQLRS
jgi:hypothetical protein